MRLFFSFLFKYLFSSRSGSLIRSVSIICILGLVGSLASLVIVISVMSGFGLSIRDRLLSFRPHLIVYENKTMERDFLDQKNNLIEGNNLKNQSDFLLQSVKKSFASNELKKNIQSIRFFETQDLIVRTSSGLFSGAVGRGYSVKDLKLLNHLQKNYFDEQSLNVEWNSEDKLLLDEDNQKTSDFSTQDTPPVQILNGNKIYMGSSLAEQLSIFEGDSVFLMPAENLLLPPGEIPPHEKALVQSLIYSGHSSTRSNDIFYEIGSMPALINTSSLSNGVELFLNNPEVYPVYKKFLKEKGFKVESWADRHSSLFFALKIEKFIMAVFLCLASLIASFSISSMIALLMTQKKRDIGILMVMGWPIKKIRRLFIHISFTMSFIGILGGILLGYLICLFIQYNPIDILPPIYQDRNFPVEIKFEVFAGACLLACILSYFASFLPVYSHTLSSCVDLIKKSQ